ncbi:hypothetical protein J34TS1_51570 [Paenibacillus azoreducens]|uniref:Uncharacterized protein n=1 Tax=Paenibacillus azoreducens TaxID=116718 RepID=A0A919YLD9_9BACL|nr:hypothetical protein J34TS1_51570 [Paenibacillus azoreducens]
MKPRLHDVYELNMNWFDLSFLPKFRLAAYDKIHVYYTGVDLIPGGENGQNPILIAV